MSTTVMVTGLLIANLVISLGLFLYGIIRDKSEFAFLGVVAMLQFAICYRFAAAMGVVPEL